jgi:hypothetical protein
MYETTTLPLNLKPLKFPPLLPLRGMANLAIFQNVVPAQTGVYAGLLP